MHYQHKGRQIMTRQSFSEVFFFLYNRSCCELANPTPALLTAVALSTGRLHAIIIRHHGAALRFFRALSTSIPLEELACWSS